MANYNGLIANLTLNGSTVSQTLGTTEVRFVGCTNAVPGKFFNFGQFGLVCTQGVSGVISVKIFGGVGGATYVIAQRDAIAVGSFPIPILLYGNSGLPTNQGIPRPYAVGFSATGGIGGFTASVFFAGEYN
jgi:hypothetical protein